VILTGIDAPIQALAGKVNVAVGGAVTLIVWIDVADVHPD
jgi:hypothetical protein